MLGDKNRFSVVLKKVKTPLLATFFGLFVTGILIIGYAFNALGGWFV